MKAPQVSALDELSWEKLYLEPNLPIFREHFPGKPVYPAFLQLFWIRRCCERRCSLTGSLRFTQVKFLKPILPGETMYLRFHATAECTARFVVSTEKGVVTKGTISLDQRVG